MKWAITILFAIFLTLFGFGWNLDRTAAGADDREGAAFLFVLSFVAFAADAILLIGWGMYRMFTT